MSRKGSSSISSHPLFRWAVAAWFAALLGGPMYVMPASIHRRIGERLGAGDLPDSTLRLAIAVAAGLIGLVLGLLIAGRGRARVEEWDEGYETEGDSAEDADYDPAGPALAEWEPLEADPEAGHADHDVAAPPARVFSARDELGGDGIAAPHHLAEAQEDAAATVGWDEAEAETVAHRSPEPPVTVRPALPETAVGDLPLPALTARLERALAAARGGYVAPQMSAPDTPGDVGAPPDTAPEEALRSALDKLSRFRRED